MRYNKAQKRLGANLLQLRKEAKLTQEKLALDAGFHRAYIGALERGDYNVTLGVLVHLAKFYKVDVAELLGGVGSDREKPEFRTNKRNQ